MPHALVVSLALLAIVALPVVIWVTSPRRRLEREFGAAAPFAGTQYDCLIRGLSYADGGTICAVGGSADGLSLTKPLARRSSAWVTRLRPDELDRPVLIPWDRLRISRSTLLARWFMRFDLPELRIHFIVPLEVARQVLTDAGRTIPD